jgi:hypothetical protein
MGKAKMPLPDPDPECGSIGLAIHTRQGAIRQHVAVQTVFFVRLDGDGDLFSATSVVPSNYSLKGHLYLLNARPGRYAAVASIHSGVVGFRGVYSFYHSQEVIQRTQVDVHAGRLSFLGHLLLNPTGKMKKADPAQSHYYHLIQPEAAGKGAFRLAMGKIYPNLGHLHQLDDGEAEEAEFWRLAKSRDFPDETGWQELIDQHLEMPP